MTLTPTMFWIVCPLAALAGFIDAIAGGGGLISLPAYYLAGLPPAIASGTNKISSTMGTTLATVAYHRAGLIDRSIGVPAAIGALVCSTIGALLMTALDDQTVRLLVLCCLPIAAVLTLKPRPQNAVRRQYSPVGTLLLALSVGCCVGFYDGLVGPGTGTFLILLFLQIFGMEEVNASGTAKIVNLASNAAALVSLIAAGKVMFLLGLPAGLCSMIGAHFGSGLAVKKGAKLIRAMMLVALTLLLAKMLADVVG